MEYHKDQLTKHCRICGKRLMKAKSRSVVYLCSDFQKDLLTYFNIDVCQDVADTHPTNFCSRCFGTRTQAAKALVPYHHAITPMNWTPHSEGDCLVKSNYKQHNS